MNEIRFGIIGVGSIATMHMGYFPQLRGGRLTALADIDAAKAALVAEEYKINMFDSAEALMDSGEVDAVLIATPHKFHPPTTIAAFERGLHVLTEKPVGVTAGDADRMNKAHARHPKCAFAAMFQQRTDPLYREAKRLIDDGQLGELKRVSWNITTWLRTQAYYNSGSWRATWEGEGGGVLLNQCPHNLDMLCWLTGLPSRVVADVSIAKYHDIEVEDEVNALLFYDNGATGTFITNTGEFPGVNRLEIVGDLGTIIVDPDAPACLRFSKVDQSVSRFIATTPKAWSTPNVEHKDLSPPRDQTPQDPSAKTQVPPAHTHITQNFIDHVRDGTPLIAPGEEGIRSLELSNAMLMSGLNDGRPVDLPTDHAAFDKLLARLIKDAKAKA